MSDHPHTTPAEQPDAGAAPAPVPASLPASPAPTSAAPASPGDLPVWGTLPASDDDGWEQMSWKKLLLGPIEALKAVIVPIGAVVIGTSSLGSLWTTIGISAVVALGALFGLVPWWVERFRVTPTQLQFRKGLLNRVTLTAPLERIRSVDLEAKLLHRLVGLRTVQVGTGVDGERIELNGMDAARAEQLRRHLLDRRQQALAGTPTSPAVDDPTAAPDAPSHLTPDASGSAAEPFVPAPATPPVPEQVLAKIDWTWLRFAPFDLARLAVIAAVVGALTQFAFEGIVPDSTWSSLDDNARTLAELGVFLLVAIVLVGGLLAWILVAIVGYVLQWWGLTLTRSHGSLHMTHGLLTTRSVSVEEQKVRGVELDEPLLLRPVRGANLFALTTGMGTSSLTRILPQAPTSVARSVGADVLGVPGPMDVALTRHSTAARRRAHVRQQWGTLVLLAIGLVGHWALMRFTDVGVPLVWFLVPAVLWFLVAPLRAELAYAHLGHALTATHFVVGSGTTTRTRTALEVDGIIGWVVERSLFQRRLGLCTLVATTAAGGEQVTLLDVEESVALQLMARATPEPVLAFAA